MTQEGLARVDEEEVGIDLDWEPFNTDRLAYMDHGTTPAIKYDIRKEECEFWDSLGYNF